jgi:COMPASS component SWD2
MRLTNEVITSGMGMGKVFQDHQKRINAMDFFHDGSCLVTSGDDESLVLYNAVSGKKTKTVFSKKYGIDLVRFSHNNQAVICASKNQWDDSIRYLSLHDNRYIR